MAHESEGTRENNILWKCLCRKYQVPSDLGNIIDILHVNKNLICTRVHIIKEADHATEHIIIGSQFPTKGHLAP